MKRNFFFLIAIATLGLVGCNHQPKSNDLVAIEKGKLLFYSLGDESMTPFEAETDSVVNLLFTDSIHLYYTVAHDQQLALKMLDLSTSKPTPIQCADWNLSVDYAMDFMTGSVNNIYLDASGKSIIILGMDPEEGGYMPYAYDLNTKTVRALSEGEDYGLRTNRTNVSRFFTEDHLFYYATPEGKTCLSDSIEFSQYFSDEDELQDLDFSPETMSPDGKKVTYSAMVLWGEGWGYYCVAALDGTSQRIMADSDIWHGCPEWLSDGSLVYIGEVPLPETDPNYEPDYNTTQSCIKLINTKGETKTLGLGSIFAVRPFGVGVQGRTEVQQAGLEGCDVAFFDNGKVTFYNSETNTFVPFVAETDSVINGVFVEDFSFYYTVKIGEELYLKEVYLIDYSPGPIMLTDWGLTISDCVSDTYGKASTLASMPSYTRVGINYNFSWDFYNFSDIKFYDYASSRKLDGWSEDEEAETDLFDDDFLQYEEDMESFMVFENNYYYLSDADPICLSDKINFKDYVSDPSYFEEPEFNFFAIDPTRSSVAYSALIEWGDLGHGPLCVASLDGTVQKAFKGTDAADLSWGWLGNGSLLYVGSEPRPTDDPAYDAEWNTTKPCVIIVHPDGTEEVLSHSYDFVVKGK